MEDRRYDSRRRWSSPSGDRHHGDAYHSRHRGRSRDAPRGDRWARRRSWTSREDSLATMRRRRRSSSWSHRGRRAHRRDQGDSSYPYSSPQLSRRDRNRRSRRRHRRRSPSPYDSDRKDSGSPRAPTVKRRRRRRSSNSELDYDHRRKFYPENEHSPSLSYERGRRRRYDPLRRSRDDSRRRRPRRRRQRSLSSSSSSERGAAMAARQAVRAGVVSPEQEQVAKPTSQNINSDRKDSPKQQQKRTSSSGSAASSRDDTVGHFRGGPGTVIANRYRVTRDVGMGTFGRVVECLDLKRRKSHPRRSSREHDKDSPRVAIKIVRNIKRYYDSALIEATILEDVNRRGGRGTSHCVVLYDAFTWSGGHFCLAFESLGPSLYDFLKGHNYQAFPMVCVRHFARQLLEALEFLHSFRLIHTDLKPENILLTNYREISYECHGKAYQIPESTQIKVIDFGGATYDDEKKSSLVNTRQYRAPEVILGVGWSTPSDLWSAGCILAELYLGHVLFGTHQNDEHLALIQRCVGPFSRRLLKRAKNSPIASQAFDSNGLHRMERILPAESASYVQTMLPLESLIREQDGHFLRLLRRLLVIDPDERAPASELVRCRI